MTIYHRTEEKAYGPTGSQIADDFFGSTSWIGSSSNGDTFDALTQSGNKEVEQDQTNNDASDQLSHSAIYQEIESLKKAFQFLARQLKNLDELTDVDDGEPFDEWLERWKEEEPEAFISDLEIKEEIHRYEEKYGMTSEEMLQRGREGAIPDNFELADWKMLLEWV